MRFIGILVIVASLSFTFYQTEAATKPIKTHKTAVSRPSKFSSYHSSLKQAIKAIENLPEAVALIEEVQTKGPVSVDARNIESFDFEAMWNSSARKIIVNTEKNKSLGKTICSILFELHNAKTNDALLAIFAMASAGTLSKDEYVEKVERMEHENAVATNRLIEKGIQLGLFPEDTRWSIFQDFNDHYMIQQIFGHSQWIANNFETMHPANRKDKFRGTIAGLESMTEQTKQELALILTLKNRAKHPNPKIAREAENKLQNLLKELEFCEENPSNPLCIEHPQKKQLLKIAFGNQREISPNQPSGARLTKRVE